MKAKNTKKQRKHTAVTDHDQVRVLSKIAAKKLLTRLSVSNANTLLASQGEDWLVLQNKTFQSVLARMHNETKTGTAFERLLASEVVINAEKLERQCYGTGYIFSTALLETLMAECARGRSNDRHEVAAQINKLKPDIAKQYVRIPRMINQRKNTIAAGACLSSAVCHALNQAGLLGTVSVEKYEDIHGGAESIIERSSGHRFHVDVLNAFLSSLSMSSFDSWDRTDVRVLVVDGVLNSVAEIDKILIGAARDKQPTMIVASYFEEEVVATVAANNLAGKTDVFLALLPRDSLESVNMANDIATCCLSAPINAHAGHGMLSFLEYPALASVDAIRIIPATKTLEITNHKAHGAVANQIKNLQEKLTALSSSGSEDRVREASSELLNKRITNLLGDRVVIKVPSTQANHLLPLYDNEIRMTKSLLQYGELINTKSFHTWFLKEIKKIQDSLLSDIATNIVKELKRIKAPIPGLAPYAVLWLVYSVASQYLAVDYAVLTNYSSETGSAR